MTFLLFAVTCKLFFDPDFYCVSMWFLFFVWYFFSFLFVFPNMAPLSRSLSPFVQGLVDKCTSMWRIAVVVQSLEMFGKSRKPRSANSMWNSRWDDPFLVRSCWVVSTGTWKGLPLVVWDGGWILMENTLISLSSIIELNHSEYKSTKHSRQRSLIQGVCATAPSVLTWICKTESADPPSL